MALFHTSIELNTIDLATAKGMTHDWRHSEHARLSDQSVLRGFFIPKKDLEQLVAMELLTGNAVHGFRGYLAMEPNPEPHTGAPSHIYKLLLVAVDDDKNDILEMHSTGQSLIFNFTKPCPNQCGTDNPLNSDQP